MPENGEVLTSHLQDNGPSTPGQKQLIENLRRYIREPIFDPKLKRLLKQASQNPTSYSEILRRLSSQIYAGSNSILYPNQSPPSQPLAACYQPLQGEANSYGWRRLISDAGKIALRLVEIKDQEEEWHRAYFVVLALRLMLLARLYTIRAEINENVVVQEPVKNAFEEPQVVVRKFLEACRDYDVQIQDWGLHQVLPPGWKEGGDSTAYNAWSRDFGKGSDAEVHWSLFARDIGAELRYLSHCMHLKQMWSKVRHPFLDNLAPEPYWKNIYKIVIQTLSHFFQALFLSIFKLTAGFGLKPGCFARTVALTILSFSFLYFLDDVLSGCCQVTWSVTDYLHEIYYAIGNFTSVGTGSGGPCGPFTQVFISIETLMGYFLLSVLAAMLVARIIDH